MENMHISEALSQSRTTQTQIAKAMGVTQGAVSQALKSKRDIFISLDERGNINNWYELKTKAKKSRK